MRLLLQKLETVEVARKRRRGGGAARPNGSGSGEAVTMTATDIEIIGNGRAAAVMGILMMRDGRAVAMSRNPKKIEGASIGVAVEVSPRDPIRGGNEQHILINNTLLITDMCGFTVDLSEGHTSVKTSHSTTS